MSVCNSTDSELEILSILLRFGGTVSYKKFKLKCNGKHIDADIFIAKYQCLISVKNDGRGEVIVVEDTVAAYNILRSYGKMLWHHGQKSHRYR